MPLKKLHRCVDDIACADVIRVNERLALKPEYLKENGRNPVADPFCVPLAGVALKLSFHRLWNIWLLFTGFTRHHWPEDTICLNLLSCLRNVGVVVLPSVSF